MRYVASALGLRDGDGERLRGRGHDGLGWAGVAGLRPPCSPPTPNWDPKTVDEPLAEINRKRTQTRDSQALEISDRADPLPPGLDGHADRLPLGRAVEQNALNGLTRIARHFSRDVYRDHDSRGVRPHPVTLSTVPFLAS